MSRASTQPISGVDVVLLVGGGCTGTTLLGERLGEIVPDAFSVHEPDLFQLRHPWRTLPALREFGLRHVAVRRVLGRSGVRALALRHLTGRREAAETAALLRRGRVAYWTSRGHPLVIESYAQWWGVLDLMPRVAASWKAVGLVRDPRDWLRSWLNYRGHHDEEDLVDRLGLGRLSGRSAPHLAPLPRPWKELGTLGRNAWDWAAIYGRLATSVEEMPGQVRLVRFEDLVTGEDRAAHLADLLDFLCTWPHRSYAYEVDEGIFARKANASRPGTLPAWPEWSPDDAALVDAICGPLMRRLGYGGEPAWEALVSQGSP